VLYLFRRVVQDRQPIRFREETPRVPGEAIPPPAPAVPVT
jgi:hypothetical protein